MTDRQIYTALDVAYEITEYINHDGRLLTYRKLQALLFILQLYSFVYKNEPLFNEDFIIEDGKPVLKSIKNEFGPKNGNFKIILSFQIPAKARRKEFNKTDMDLINDIMEHFSSKTTDALEQSILEANENELLYHPDDTIINKERISTFAQSLEP